MIDSIQFSVHDLQVHKKLVDYLYRPGISGKELQYVEMTAEEQDFEMKKRVFHGRQFRDYTLGTIGKVKRFSYRDFIKSSNYNVSFAIGADCIEFNFSIPKYLYGTNVFQFLPHTFDSDYRGHVDLDKSLIRNAFYKRFHKFLEYFFRVHCGSMVDMNLLEIDRVDLTFVKIFQNKEQAWNYLIELKRVSKKRWRENSKAITNYNGGIYYPTSDYTFKVYHKGTEFMQNDRAEIKELVKKGVISHEEVERIQRLADRMVRYEVEFRPSYINKLYKNKGFLEYDPILIKRARNLFKNGYFTSKGKKYFMQDLKRSEKSYYNKLMKEYNKVYAIKLDNKYSGGKREIYLDRDLFNSMFAVLGRMVNHFTVKSSIEFESLIYRGEEFFMRYTLECLHKKYGREEGDKLIKIISFRMLRTIIKDLKFETLKEQFETQRIARATYFRYQKVLKSLGIGQALSQDNYRESENHIKDYYIAVNTDCSRINILHKYRLVI